MAFKRGSRYEQTPYYQGDGLGRSQFRGTRTRRITSLQGVLEHTIEAGQRLDLLALHYYNDDRKWWRILDANPHILNADEVLSAEYEGETIVIPR